MVTKKIFSPAVWNIAALVTILVIVFTFTLMSEKGYRLFNGKAVADKTSAEDHEVQIGGSRVVKPRKRSIREKKLNDALWTSKPKFPRKMKNALEDINSVNDENIELMTQSAKPSFINSTQTTPLYTDKPTTPITTQSITTPIYTDAPTTPITTQSVTTPLVTEPGQRDITTEKSPDEDPNETLRLIRRKRQSGNSASLTTTQKYPLTTSVKPPACDKDDDDADYNGPNNGSCECGYGKKGPGCKEDMDDDEQERQRKKSIQFEHSINGPFNNSLRKQFQEELEKYYQDLDSFERVYVYPLSYDPVTNTSKFSYIVFYKRNVTADDINKASSMTANVTSENLKLLVANANVTFGQNLSYLIQDKIDGTVNKIPIGAQVNQEACYIYNKTDACHVGQGVCVAKDGEPYCLCTTEYVGKYCQEKVLKAPETDTAKILTILLPVLAAIAAVAMACSCCWLLLRRVNKGEDEYSEFSSVTSDSAPVVLPRYYPQYRQFVHEEDVAPVIIERPIIQPVIVERTLIRDRPKPVRVERVVKEEVIRRPVVVERIYPDLDDLRVTERVVPEEELEGHHLRATREIRDIRPSRSNDSDDLSWMFGEQSHDRFRIRPRSINGQADSRFNYFDSKYSS